MTPRKLLTVSEVAGRFGVSARTVQRWADDDMLPAMRTLGGARRFDPDVVDRALAGEL